MQEAALGVEDVIKEFPKARKYLKNFDDGEFKIVHGAEFDDAYMITAPDSKAIGFNKKFFTDYDSLAQSIAEDVRYGGHPKNTTLYGCGAHEMGHWLEWAIIKKNKGTVDDWNVQLYSGKIVREAVANVQATPAGKTMIVDHRGKLTARKKVYIGL